MTAYSRLISRSNLTPNSIREFLYEFVLFLEKAVASRSATGLITPDDVTRNPIVYSDNWGKDLLTILGGFKGHDGAFTKKYLNLATNSARSTLGCNPVRCCRNTMLCPYCNKAFRDLLYARYLEMDPSLIVCVRRKIIDFPRGVILRGSAVVPQCGADMEAYGEMMGFDYAKEQLLNKGFGGFMPAFHNPDQFYSSIYRAVCGSDLYDEIADVDLYGDAFYNALESRRESLRRRKKPSTEDSVPDMLLKERAIITGKINCNALASRIVYYPWLSQAPYLIPITRFELIHLFLVRPGEMNFIKDNPLFQTDCHYKFHPFYKEMETPICYREKTIFRRVRKNTKSYFYELLCKYFSPMQSYSGFLIEEALAYFIAFSGRQLTLRTGEFADR